MDELVVGALQKSGVNSHNRFQPIAGHAGGKGDGMLLGNGNIVVATRVLLRELHHA